MDWHNMKDSLIASAPILALIISSIALLISITALWVNSLSPFKLKVYHDAPTFSIYKFKSEQSGNMWWIPSFDVGVSFYNIGRIPGEILDIRITAEFKGYRNNRKHYFYPMWLVDYSVFNSCRSERFEWIDKAILRDWYPFLLKGQDEVNMHVILEGDSWDQKETGEMSFTFEAISSKKQKWIPYGQYSFPISESMYESKGCYTALDKKIEELRKM